MKKYNYFLAVVFLAVGAGMIYFVKDFPYGGLSDIGGGFWPRILGGLLMIGAVGLAIDTKIGEESEDTLSLRAEGMKRVITMCGVMVVFCVIMKFLGFFLGVAFMVPACAMILGERNKKKLVLITAGVIIFMYVIFEVVLHTGLPGGFFFRRYRLWSILFPH